MTDSHEYYSRSFPIVFVLMFLSGLIVGGIAVYYVASQQIRELTRDISSLQSQVSALWGTQNITYQNITVYQNGTALSELYSSVRDSIVLIKGSTGQGSGFVYNFSGTMVVITNYHVVQGSPTSLSVTFADGNGYAAAVEGTDRYADIAVLTVDAPLTEFKPLEIVSSSTLHVGNPVVAIGNPYGLVGSMTTGIVSALGRTITEEYTGGFAIANIIQTSAPINPGNSGGPLLNYQGKVVGITAAIVQNSQGLGFAIPSNTILREIMALVTYHTYSGHSYMGLNGTDMDYEAAQEMHVSVTYGWRVVYVAPDGPSAGVLQTDDVIIAMRSESSANSTRIRNGDDLASYLEENTFPEQTLELTIVRGTETRQASIVLAQRP